MSNCISVHIYVAFLQPNLISNCRLLVPGLELIYLWNGFSIIGRHYNLVESVYVAVQVLKSQYCIHKMFSILALHIFLLSVDNKDVFFWFSLCTFKQIWQYCVTGGWGVLEVRNLFDRELLSSPAPQRGLPQIYGWDSDTDADDDDNNVDDNVSLGG